jgi:hypothetical protein
MGCEVHEQAFRVLRAVSEQPDRAVAINAQQSSPALFARCIVRAARVVVIDGQSCPMRIQSSAHRAYATLARQHHIVVSSSHSVMLHQPPSEPVLFDFRTCVPYPVVANTALACSVVCSATALTKCPLRLRQRGGSGTQGDTRAQQGCTYGSVVMGSVLNTNAFSDQVDRQAFFRVKPGYLYLLLWSKSPLASHDLKDIYLRSVLKIISDILLCLRWSLSLDIR